MRTKARAAQTFVIVFFGLACQHSENRYLHRTVQPAELVGRWMGTPFAMESLRYAGYKTHLDAKEHRLLLNADGSCRAETVVNPSEASPDGAGAWVSASMPCRWRLGTDGEHQTLELMVSAASGGDRRLSFYFDEEDGGITLWQFAGDPDAWKYMEFRKSTGAG